MWFFRQSPWAVWVVAAALLISTFRPAAAENWNDDFQQWSVVSLKLPVSERWNLHLQSETRLIKNMTRLDRQFVQPGISYDLSDHWNVRANYFYVPDFDPGYSSEHRLTQDLSYSRSFPKLHNIKFSIRNRIEQRFFEGVGGPSVRFRVRPRLQYPIGDSPWYTAIQNEFFFNLNSPDNGPRAGYRENRIYAAVGRHIGENVSAEAGYQLVWSDRQSPSPDRAAHLLLVQVSIDVN